MLAMSGGDGGRQTRRSFNRNAMQLIKTVFPFSGDVTQAINPWSWFEGALQSAGFINIYNFNSPEPDTERQITEKVGSYGRQLGWLMEALEVLIRRSDLNYPELTSAEHAALHQFRELLDDVRALKGERCRQAPHQDARMTPEDADRFVERVLDLKNSDPKAYEDMRDRICRGLPDK